MIPLNFLTHPQVNRPHPALRRAITAAALFTALLLLSACQQAGQMRDQPRYDPLEASALFPDGRSARPALPGTVSYRPEGAPDAPALTGLDESGRPLQGFPEPLTQEMLALGQKRYNIFCVPCHGPAGAGDGTVTKLGFPQPPDLLTGAAATTLSNGEIFQIVTDGRGQMFSYGYRVKPPERWAVIAYVRALQLKNGPVDPQTLTPEDLSQLENMP